MDIIAFAKDMFFEFEPEEPFLLEVDNKADSVIQVTESEVREIVSDRADRDPEKTILVVDRVGKIRFKYEGCHD